METQSMGSMLLRYSSVAFALLIIFQSCWFIIVTPRFSSLFTGFGASIPPMIMLALKAYWIVSILIVAISLASTIYIWLRHRVQETHLKIAYGLALTSLVGSFAWSGFIAIAVYQPIFKMGASLQRRLALASSLSLSTMS